MRLFRYAVSNELHCLGWKRISFILLFFAGCLFFLQTGLNNYVSTLEHTRVFRATEKEKVLQYVTYTQYGTYGIRIHLLPAPLGVFFMDSCVMPDTEAYVDSGERLKIYNSLKGKNLFLQKKKGLTDFAGILLAVGSILALLYGRQGFLPRTYLKFLSSVSGSKKIYLLIVLSRILIITLLYLLLFAAARFQLLFNGILFPISGSFLKFFLVGYLVLLFFFALGVIIGTRPHPGPGLVLPIGLWLALVFIIPTAIDYYTAERAKTITPEYRLDNKKLKTVMNFENRTIDEAGEFNYGKKVTKKDKEFVLSY
ncbi:MAG: hypothetical protein JSV88_32520 [Candidatus Aminicenantes bacterium]|nr:MAG: hypothetical protein JSV88_32520 [Candidatus Aminicenantes bacterium]